MNPIKCAVCGRKGRVKLWICGVEVTDSCPICNGLGIIPPELHELVEVRPLQEVERDRV
jgi:hypothetical protein